MTCICTFGRRSPLCGAHEIEEVGYHEPSTDCGTCRSLFAGDNMPDFAVVAVAHHAGYSCFVPQKGTWRPPRLTRLPVAPRYHSEWSAPEVYREPVAAPPPSGALMRRLIR